MGEALSLAGEAERALSSWVLGTLDARGALGAICAAVGAREATCWIVQSVGEGAKALGPEGVVADAALLSRAVRALGPGRALRTPRDADWPALVEGQARAAQAVWLACEPVAEDDKERAHLVVVGFAEARRDEILIALPLLARASAAIIERERAAHKAGRVTHAIRNLLASLLANGEYVVALLEEERPGADATEVERRAQVLEAMSNVLAATEQLRPLVERLQRAAVRDGT